MNNFEVVFRCVTIVAVVFVLALEKKVGQWIEDEIKDLGV